MLEGSGAVEVVDAQIDAYNARDLDKILTYYAPGAVIRDARDGRFEDRGLDAIRAVFDTVFAANPDLHADTEEIFGVREWVAAHVVVATFRSGDQIAQDVHWLEVYRVIDGLVHELNIYRA